MVGRMNEKCPNRLRRLSIGPKPIPGGLGRVVLWEEVHHCFAMTTSSFFSLLPACVWRGEPPCLPLATMFPCDDAILTFWEYECVNSSFSKLLLVMVFLHSNRKIANTHTYTIDNIYSIPFQCTSDISHLHVFWDFPYRSSHQITDSFSAQGRTS